MTAGFPLPRVTPSGVVVFSVLGGADFISGGAYSWRDLDASVSVFKIPLRYEPDAGRPYAIGDTGLRWSNVFTGWVVELRVSIVF